MTPDQRRRTVRHYAGLQEQQVHKKQKCSCHAMADLYGFAAPLYMGAWNNDEESYVEDLALILARCELHVGSCPSRYHYAECRFLTVYHEAGASFAIARRWGS